MLVGAAWWCLCARVNHGWVNVHGAGHIVSHIFRRVRVRFRVGVRVSCVRVIFRRIPVVLRCVRVIFRRIPVVLRGVRVIFRRIPVVLRECDTRCSNSVGTECVSRYNKMYAI